MGHLRCYHLTEPIAQLCCTIVVGTENIDESDGKRGTLRRETCRPWRNYGQLLSSADELTLTLFPVIGGGNTLTCLIWSGGLDGPSPTLRVVLIFFDPVEFRLTARQRFAQQDFPADRVHHGTWTNQLRSRLNCNLEVDPTVRTSFLLVLLAGIVRVVVT